MTQYIHYEANIFMLNDLLRHIRKILKLDIDNDYFLDKIKSDLLFSESKLANLYEALKDSTLQLDKDQYLRHLYKTKNLYIEIAESIINNSSGRSLDFSDFIPRLKEAVYEQQYEYNDISDILSKNNEADLNSDQISQEELMFLMSSEQEPNEE
jgi:hypothetical protein